MQLLREVTIDDDEETYLRGENRSREMNRNEYD